MNCWGRASGWRTGAMADPASLDPARATTAAPPHAGGAGEQAGPDDPVAQVRWLVEECYAEVAPTVAAGGDFFAQGGDSLQLLRIVARVQQAFQVEVAAEDFFRTPTPEVLARLVTRALGLDGGGAGVAP